MLSMRVAGKLSVKLLMVGAYMFFSALPARAVVVHDRGTTGTPSSHTVRPIPDPGWDNVGWGSNGLVPASAGSAVYLGNGWVLTANHTVGSREITLGDTFASGNLFQWDNVTPPVRLKNPNNTNSDLIMYHVAGNPGLPVLKIASTAPAVNDSLIFIATGVERDNGFNQYPRGSSSSADDYFGYDWSSNRIKAWGTNAVEDDPDGNAGVAFLRAVSGSNTWGFMTIFDDFTGEAHTADKDSGGAVFIDVTGNGDWRLGGIISAVFMFQDQPGLGLNDAALIGNATFVADLSVYYDQIAALIPEPTTAAMLGGLMLVLAGRRPRR